ncbi:hypothetical protein [Crystallibacter crystallopoietes]|uniref:hypothetical protein n=1 Tax=Crystallibacter crystallopoietes TaxID=37928 RepID=UPI000309A5C6|nr:hypothetical protein [Arthrobacter crystallopoietes]
MPEHGLSAAIAAADGEGAAGAVLVTVRNDSDSPVLLLAVTLYANGYDGGADWVPERSGGFRVAPGNELSVAAALPEVRCSAGEPGDAEVAITVDQAKAGSTTVEVVAQDEQQVLVRHHRRECRQEAAAAAPRVGQDGVEHYPSTFERRV